MPVITDGTVSPSDVTVDFGSEYSVVCSDGYTVSAESNMLCQADGTLDVTLTCDSKLIVVGNHYSVSSAT